MGLGLTNSVGVILIGAVSVWLGTTGVGSTGMGSVGTALVCTIVTCRLRESGAQSTGTVLACTVWIGNTTVGGEVVVQACTGLEHASLGLTEGSGVHEAPWCTWSQGLW